MAFRPHHEFVTLLQRHGVPFCLVDLFDYIPGYPSEDVQTLFDTAHLIKDVRYASLEWLKKVKQAAAPMTSKTCETCRGRQCRRNQ